MSIFLQGYNPLQFKRTRDLTPKELDVLQRMRCILHCHRMWRRDPEGTLSYLELEELTRINLNLAIAEREVDGWQLDQSYFTRTITNSLQFGKSVNSNK